MRLTLKGSQQYWFHPTLIAVLRERTGWDEKQSQQFIAKSDFINFNGINPKTGKAILESLQAAGFLIQLDIVKGDYVASLAMPYHEELAAVKKQMGELSQRIAALETDQAFTKAENLQASPAFYQLSEEAASAAAPEKAPSQPAAPSAIQRGTSESNIGRYWLSRIGVISMLLGVTLLISYSFQYINAYGKILMGLVIGAGMIGAGNFAARKEKDRQWAMGIIGGGWAIVYFTVFASYQVPMTRIIHNPFFGLVLLLAVAAGAILQSLAFNSAVLVVFSYLLAFLALTTAPAGTYTLMASFILACSLLIVLKKKQWTALSLLAFVAVYLIHYLWLEPGIYHLPDHDRGRLFEVFYLPWTGETWKLYPIITTQQSYLHQGFLILYWLLFTALGFFKNLRTKDDEVLVFGVLAGNSFLFTGLYLDHLHGYYPAIKYFFPLVMSGVFGVLFELERRRDRMLFADLYLALSVTLLCLTLPMYFDGPALTYGWSAAAVVLAWTGLRYARKILQIIAVALAGIVLCRVLCLEYKQQTDLFRLIVPIKECFFLFTAAGIAFFLLFLLYRRTTAVSEQTKNLLQNIFLSAVVFTFGTSWLIGGPRAAASVLWVAAAMPLMMWSIINKNKTARVLSLIALFFAAARLSSVDYGIELSRLFVNAHDTMRLIFSGAAAFAILGLADQIRRGNCGASAVEVKCSNIMTAVAAFLVLCYFYDGSLGSWVTIIWGVTGLAFLSAGFGFKDKVYRWCGLGIFAVVILRLFTHDFSHLETIYRIISFMGLGGVLIAASLLYNKYSKVFLADEGK